MAIKAKLHEVRDAFRAFQGVMLPDGSTRGGIGNAVLPAKAAYRVGRLVQKLKNELRVFEETQRKLFRDAGAEQIGNALELPRLERKENESDADWEKRLAERRMVTNELNDKIEELLDTDVEIDYDPIPMSLFEDEKNPAKTAQLLPNDIALAGPFLRD